MAVVIVSGIASPAAGAYYVVQPPVGEQWIITHCAGKNAGGPLDGTVQLYNGSLAIFVGAVINAGTVYKIFIDNSIYLRIENLDGAAQDMGFCGVKL